LKAVLNWPSKAPGLARGLDIIELLAGEPDGTGFNEMGSRYATVHASALGKVLLTFMTEDKREQHIGSGNDRLKKVAEHTITDRLALRNEMKTIRAMGFAAMTKRHASVSEE